MSAVFREYLWIAVLGGIMGFAYGFLIGANDVANSFASSISSKSLTLKQAVMAASVCEFGGAMLLGASVTSTIRSKVVFVDLYDDNPALLMFGMFTSLLSAVIMLAIATAFGYPVSTTHDIVGCIMGFSIAAKGFDSVDWVVGRNLFMSWIVSPLLAGSLSFIFFLCVKYFVLTAEKPFQRAYYTFPIVLTIGIGIDLFYVLYKGASNTDFAEKVKVGWILPLAFGVGLVCGLIWIFIVGPIALKRIEANNARAEAAKEIADEKQDPEAERTEEVFDDSANTLTKTSEPETPGQAAVKDSMEDVQDEKPEASGGFKGMVESFGARTYNQDLHAQSMHESEHAAKLWEDGDDYDADTENLFNFIQVFTACLNSFAHGANDVSNTLAPMSAILYIYQNGELQSKNEVQKWVLAYAGGAIVLGLLLYGYNVMKSIGYKLTKLSASRGACAELAASLTVVTASFLALPVSSTQCIVGAVTGVGLVNGVRSVDWLFLLKVMFGWVGMFFSAVLLSAGVFSFAAFSPPLELDSP